MSTNVLGIKIFMLTVVHVMKTSQAWLLLHNEYHFLHIPFGSQLSKTTDLIICLSYFISKDYKEGKVFELMQF